MNTIETNGCMIPCDAKKTDNWYAWNNLMPPGPPSFHVIGDVEVPNPGVDVLLTERVPQGINPRIVLLELHLIQRPGLWPQVVVRKQARFDKAHAAYSDAEVFSGAAVIAKIKVENVG